MARISRRIAPYVTLGITHPRARDARRWIAEQRRRLSGGPRCVRYFHQVDDPYSHLVVQVLGELLERYDVEIGCHLVGPPLDDAAPERERLSAFARKDAADVAPAYGLRFPEHAGAPDRDSMALASRMLLAASRRQRFVEEAAEVGDAVWSGDRSHLDVLAAARDLASEADTEEAVRAGSALREKLGHYLGGMLHYGGEWYWGVDRLWHLERRLQELGALRANRASDPIVPRPDPSVLGPVESDGRLKLEYYPSLRSPYTAIAMRRTFDLAERLPVDLIVRPVLPMVMRGLPVPFRKRIYIVLDTKREATDAGEAFGFMCDPVGRPVERCFSLYPWACEQGRGKDLLASFTDASFAEGIDTGEDEGLRGVVERCGLSWAEARKHLDQDTGWRAEVEANREQLFSLGLWGVPSYRLIGEEGAADFCTWGQDRIWRVEEEIRNRLV